MLYRYSTRPALVGSPHPLYIYGICCFQLPAFTSFSVSLQGTLIHPTSPLVNFTIGCWRILLDCQRKWEAHVCECGSAAVRHLPPTPHTLSCDAALKGSTMRLMDSFSGQNWVKHRSYCFYLCYPCTPVSYRGVKSSFTTHFLQRQSPSTLHCVSIKMW